MANDCSNKLTVVGLQCAPEKFTKALELAMYGKEVDEGEYYAVDSFEGRPEQFLFNTKWQPPVNALLTLSERQPAAVFLLDYLCWESDFRGQLVIQDGKVIESIRRTGYNGPAYLWSDITHPVVDLFGPYVAPKTLAQHAAERIQDAIGIINGLRETLEDERFTNSRYRALGNDSQLKKATADLSEMVNMMIRYAEAISFEGVLVETEAQ
jgi:hypothetical protein